MFFEWMEIMKHRYKETWTKETQEHYKPKKHKIGHKMNMKSRLETWS